MRAFENIDAIKSEAKPRGVVEKRKLHILGFAFIVLLTFSCCGITLSNSSLSQEVKIITSYWAPNLSDLGKIKYVDADEEVMATISEFSMPFDYTYVTELEDGGFEINGLGGLVVKSCMKGVVKKIANDDEGRTITIDHGKSLKTVYSYLDVVGVKEGDGVEKNTPIGISNNSKILFKVVYKNKVLAGLCVSDGQFSFL